MLPGERLFVLGTTGSGKSETLLARLARIVEAGQGGPRTLVLLPDRARTLRWRETLDRRLNAAHAPPRITTYSAFASRALRAWWPEISRDLVARRGADGAEGEGASLEPAFLDYESAQFLMSEIVIPRLEQGYFAGLAMRPQRIVSQLLDNLNKAAMNGYGIDEVQARLSRAWSGPDERLRHYAQAQDCIRTFRARCLEKGLVDFSLTIELFEHEILDVSARRQALLGEVRHLLVDDLDESVPLMHDLLGRLLETVDSAVLAYDPWGGHRVFLGADARGALRVAEGCDRVIRLEGIGTRASVAAQAGFATEAGPVAGTRAFAELAAALFQADGPPELASEAAHVAASEDPVSSPADESRMLETLAALAAPCVLLRTDLANRAAMIDEAAAVAAEWIRAGLPAGDIAIVSPYLDAGLRFTLEEALAERGIVAVARRHHRMLRDEPAVRAALTAAALSFPEWGVPPEPYALAEALCTLEPRIDAARASLLIRGLYDRAQGRLLAGDRLDMQDHDRIGFEALEAYGSWQAFLSGGADAERRSEAERDDVASSETLDAFLRRLFVQWARRGRPEPETARTFDQLLASVERFQAVAPKLDIPPESIGPAFLRLVQQGTVTAQQDPAGTFDPDALRDASNTLLITPAHSYLVDDRRHGAQIWLDVGGLDWWRPPQQPLTNPWILSRSWPADLPWSPELDAAIRDRVLARLCAALAARADSRLALLACAEDKLGVPAEGPLLRLTERIEAQAPSDDEARSK